MARTKRIIPPPDLSHIAEALRHLAVPIETLAHDPANARTHGEQNLASICASLRRFGQRLPLVVQREGMIVRSGNGRLDAALSLGWTHIAALIVDEADAEATAWALCDNRSSELAEWDDARLASLLKTMPQDVRCDVGFSDKDMNELLASLAGPVVEDEAPAPLPEPVSKRGDLWLLGIYYECENCLQKVPDGVCSDALQSEVLQRRMPNGPAAGNAGEVQKDDQGESVCESVVRQGVQERKADSLQEEREGQGYGGSSRGQTAANRPALAREEKDKPEGGVSPSAAGGDSRGKGVQELRLDEAVDDRPHRADEARRGQLSEERSVPVPIVQREEKAEDHRVCACGGRLIRKSKHRILCGDSTDGGDVALVMDGERAGLCFTSPPYADAREYGGADVTVTTLVGFIAAWASHSDLMAVNLGIVRRDGAVVRYWDQYIAAAEGAGLKLLSWNIWDRQQPWSMAQNTAMFPIEHEWVFVFGAKPSSLNLTVENKTPGTRTCITNRQADGTLERSEPKEVRTHRPLGTIFRAPPHIGKDMGHPAMFPVSLPSAYIEACTGDGDVVGESFGGSGTTIIAAEQLKRRCYAVEIEPVYVDVAVRRWEKLTGLKATLDGDGHTFEQVGAERGTVSMLPEPAAEKPPKAGGSKKAKAPAV